MEDSQFDIPEVGLEQFETPEQEFLGVLQKAEGSQIVGVLGLGHCGSRLAEAFYTTGYTKALALNTATADLKPIGIPEEQKIHLDIGQEGAAKQLHIGEEAVQRHKDAIYDRMSRVFDKVDRIVVCFGIGGGTGGGGFTNLIGVARTYADRILGLGKKEVGRRITVVATTPDDGELRDQHTAKNAQAGLKAVIQAAKADVSPVILADNGRVRGLYPGIPAGKYRETVNRSIAGLYHVFNLVSARSSRYENLDPADYDAILSKGGFALMGAANVPQWNTKEELAAGMRDNFRRTLLADGDLTTAQACGVVVVAGEDVMDQVPQANLDYGIEAVTRATKGAVTYRGLYADTKAAGRLRVYTLVSGMKPPAELVARIDRRVKDGEETYP